MAIVTVRRPAVARAPALAGNAALAGLVACGALVCLGAAAAGPTNLIPASWHGAPGWLSGPLPRLGDGLGHATFAALVLVMCACYAVVLATARELDSRAALGVVVALHALFLVAPP